MRPELFDQAGFGVSLCLQRRFGYTFVFFLSELTGRLLVLPLDCFAEGRLRFVADTERDLSETVVVLAAPLPEFYRLVSSFKFGDDETEVVQACGKYLALTHKLVEFFVARFGESDR